ncbi:MAG: exodeoxyribonuclease VII small subunit [Zoogloeaceae bacterium]|nr:exodeoxyribonuclease VII small subunit [Zoogloeaceae bacterium]
MSKPAATPKSFESALNELEGIVEQLEGSTVSLEQALAQYQRGVGLLKFCQETLDKAEEVVRVLEQGALAPLPNAESRG